MNRKEFLASLLGAIVTFPILATLEKKDARAQAALVFGRMTIDRTPCIACGVCCEITGFIKIEDDKALFFDSGSEIKNIDNDDETSKADVRATEFGNMEDAIESCPVECISGLST